MHQKKQQEKINTINKVNKEKTSFEEVLDMYDNHNYLELIKLIKEEEWSQKRMLEFAQFFCRYKNNNELNILIKFF